MFGVNEPKPLVGFKLEGNKVGIDSMLNAINTGETDGIDGFATLNDLDGRSGIFNTRDALDM